MKRVILIILAIVIIAPANNVSAQRRKKQQLETINDSLSYAIGVSVANSIKKQNVPNLDIEKFYLAIVDAFEGEGTKMDANEANKIIQTKLKVLQEEAKKLNLILANEFLDENKTKQGVVTLPSGLQYKVLKEGEGACPTAANKVKTHYKGTFLDGTVFDSSYEGEPISFGVTRVIKGWQEALQLMKPGAKWKLFVHPDLAYGERSTGPIPPNSLLIFEIELISVE